MEAPLGILKIVWHDLVQESLVLAGTHTSVRTLD